MHLKNTNIIVDTNIVYKNDKVNELHGKKLYNDKSSLRCIVDIMESKSGEELYKKYLTDWTNARTMIMFMKTYAIVKEKYIEKYGLDPSKYYLTFLLFNIINNNHYRKMVIDNMYSFIEDKNKSKIIKKTILNSNFMN